MPNELFPSKREPSAHQPKPVPTGVNPFEQDWLNVEQAVVLCAELGLTRTPKTIRKWAERSNGLAGGDVLARKEDTPWGYRWLIEKASLTCKVQEEVELRSANPSEPLQTIVHSVMPRQSEKTNLQNTEQQVNRSEPVRPSAEQFEPKSTSSDKESSHEQSAHQFEQVRNRSEIEAVLDEVRARMSDKDREIAFLRDQLSEAQAEIGRRAASTDEALKTIDRVVRSFEMQAEANKTLALRGEVQREYQEQTQPIRFAPESVDNAGRHQDIRRV